MEPCGSVTFLCGGNFDVRTMNLIKKADYVLVNAAGFSDDQNRLLFSFIEAVHERDCAVIAFGKIREENSLRASGRLSKLLVLAALPPETPGAAGSVLIGFREGSDSPVLMGFMKLPRKEKISCELQASDASVGFPPFIWRFHANSSLS